jgi:hypothetical protein
MITEQELLREKPLVVRITAQEVGLMYATRTTPYEYMQFILGRLRETGGPVEGTLHLKLTHGNVYRVKNSPEGPGVFDFMWVPPAWAQAMNEQGGIMGDVDPSGVKMEVV